MASSSLCFIVTYLVNFHFVNSTSSMLTKWEDTSPIFSMYSSPEICLALDTDLGAIKAGNVKE